MSRLSLGIATAFAFVACAAVAFAAGMGGAMMHGHTYKMNALGNSGQNGWVTLTRGTKVGTTVVKVTLTGEPMTANEPAHIHLGSCPTAGAVKYPLKNVVHGSSLTTVNAPIASLGAGMSVNVHKSASHLNIYVSCGNL